MRFSLVLLALAGLVATGCLKSEPVTGSTPQPSATTSPAPKEESQPAPRTAEQPAPQPAAPSPATAYAERTKMLLEAADKGQVSLFVELVKKGADVNDKGDDGQTPLHRAAAKGHKSMVVTLLVLGADMGEKNAKGLTPLMVAAESGNAEVLTLLVTPDKVQGLAKDALGLVGDGVKLDLGALGNRLGSTSTDALDRTDPAGRTALMMAAANGHADCAKAILSTDYQQRRTRVLQADKQGRNSLMHAAAGGHTPTLDVLLYWGPDKLADLRLTDPDGKTAIDLAEAGGHKLAARRLWIELAPRAAAAGDLAAVKAAVEKYPAAIDPSTLMRHAAQGGGVAVIKHLKEQAKDKSAEEKLRLMTGERTTTGSYHTALWEALNYGQPAAIKEILDLDWWKDRDALVAYLKTKVTIATDGTSTTVITNGYSRQQNLELVKGVEETLKQLEAGK